MKGIILLTVSLFYLNSFSQKKMDLKNYEKSRVEIESLSLINLELASQKANTLLKYAENTKLESEIAKAKSTLAYLKIFETKTSEAEILNNQSLKIHLKLKNENEIAKNYFNSALIYSRKSDFVTSVGLFIKAIDLAKKNKNYLLVQKNYRGLANSYCDQKNYEMALKYASKALEFTKFESSISETSYINATIAEIYRLKEEYNKANLMFEKAYVGFKKINEAHGQAYVLTNWSLCYENDYSKLLEMELQAQEIWDKIAPENLMSVTNLGNLAYTYFDIAQNQQLQIETKKIIGNKSKIELINIAEEYYSRCLEIARKKNNLDSVLYFSESLSLLQQYKGDFKNAYQNLKLRNKINDSLYSQKNKNKIAALESEKEIQIRDKKIEINKIKLQNKEKEKWFLIAGIALFGIIGSLLFYQSRNRKKTNEKLQLLNTELDEANKAKTRFFSILNHDLRGPVANLVFFLQLQKESPEMLDEESTKRMQDKTMTGAENLLNSMEDILQWSKSQMENFKPQPKNIAISSLFEDTKNHFSSEEKVQIIFENPENIQILTDENYLKTIIRNLTGNAIKALNEIENPVITWKAWQENNVSYLSITDNGKGATDQQFKALYDDKEIVGIKTGLGLHLIRDLAKSINCEIKVTSKIDEGSTFILKL